MFRRFHPPSGRSSVEPRADERAQSGRSQLADRQAIAFSMLYCGLLILSLLLAHGDALYLGQPLTSRRRLSEPRACAMPMEPTPELGVQEVCKVVCAGMQHWNDPFPDAGLTRLYNFMTAQGRVALAPPPPKAGLQGGVTLEYFLKEAAGPAIGTFMECAPPLIHAAPTHAVCVHATATASRPAPSLPSPPSLPYPARAAVSPVLSCTHPPTRVQVHALRPRGRADRDAGHHDTRRAGDAAHRGPGSG